ncbi:hypothetical protein HPB50_011244 [Hyalomma asiaticum]|uniref:Uncharacterized protein n=1 Tax=Hyalomma asiaticum TaxID=266040 RepID=A0ACB7SGX3_HYAAI|nr:hypothetical protein HPB50_011244 [Hyalomma asiaticum]
MLPSTIPILPWEEVGGRPCTSWSRPGPRRSHSLRVTKTTGCAKHQTSTADHMLRPLKAGEWVWVPDVNSPMTILGPAQRLHSYVAETPTDVPSATRYLRMPPHTFDTLLHLVRSHIKRKDTNFRKAISSEHRLAQTVRFLAAGNTLRTSCFNFLNGHSTACNTVSSVCKALWDVLGPVYVACPSSADEWLQIASEFEELWNMPHCVGEIDGKHVAIECPAKSGSEDHKYKNFFSKSMLAISDACYSYTCALNAFLYVEVGHHGSDSDGGVFSRSELHKAVTSNNQGFPHDTLLGNTGNVPFYLVGDEAFPLKTY